MPIVTQCQSGQKSQRFDSRTCPIGVQLQVCAPRLIVHGRHSYAQRCPPRGVDRKIGWHVQIHHVARNVGDFSTTMGKAAPLVFTYENIAQCIQLCTVQYLNGSETCSVPRLLFLVIPGHQRLFLLSPTAGIDTFTQTTSTPMVLVILVVLRLVSCCRHSGMCPTHTQ